MIMKKKYSLKSGEKQELCRAVHAEQNAIISASREKMLGATLYLVGKTYTDGKYVEWTGDFLYSDIPFTVDDPILKTE